MYFYTKLITILNNNSKFHKPHTYIRKKPEKEKKKFQISN